MKMDKLGANIGENHTSFEPQMQNLGLKRRLKAKVF
jgi:hypothetical protein